MKDGTKLQFLEKLQAQAELQARLNTHRFFPAQMDVLTSFIGRYPWQFLLVVSCLTSVAIEILTRI